MAGEAALSLRRLFFLCSLMCFVFRAVVGVFLMLFNAFGENYQNNIRKTNKNRTTKNPKAFPHYGRRGGAEPQEAVFGVFLNVFWFFVEFCCFPYVFNAFGENCQKT